MICYELFEGWLLLSLPSSCLRPRTPFLLTLSRYLGTLTSGWDFPLSDMELTPHALAPKIYDDDTFGVQQGTERFLFLNPQLVLYRIIYLP